MTQSILQPEQPSEGPGGSSNYVHTEVEKHDYNKTEKGYWLFTPKNVGEQPVDVVVFMHGYGAIKELNKEY